MKFTIFSCLIALFATACTTAFADEATSSIFIMPATDMELPNPAAYCGLLRHGRAPGGGVYEVRIHMEARGRRSTKPFFEIYSLSSSSDPWQVMSLNYDDYVYQTDALVRQADDMVVPLILDNLSRAEGNAIQEIGKDVYARYLMDLILVEAYNHAVHPNVAYDLQSLPGNSPGERCATMKNPGPATLQLSFKLLRADYLAGRTDDFASYPPADSDAHAKVVVTLQSTGSGRVVEPVTQPAE